MGLALGLLALGCGGETAKVAPAAAPGSGGQSDALPCSGDMMPGCAGASMDSDGSTEPFCATETKVAAPTGSTNCVVSVRKVDPVFSCGRSECTVKRALDLECAFLPRAPSLSATDDGAVLMAIADADVGMPLARIMTVDHAGARVEDISELADPSDARPARSILDGALIASPHGRKWLFAGRAAPLTTLRENEWGWTRSLIPPPSAPNTEALLTDALMLDDELGFVSYASEAPHLVMWDGSCWSDQAIGDVSSVGAMAVAVDEQRRPWTAWFSASTQVLGPRSLFLRSPNGETKNLSASLEPDGAGPINVRKPLRLLSGGLDGTAEFPLVAVRAEGGLAVVSRISPTDPEWRLTWLPEPAGSVDLGAHCPVGNVAFNSNDDPCSGLTSCDAQWSAVSSAFDLVRTPAGGVFAAWVVYSSEGSYSLQSDCVRGELPHCVCTSHRASGTGTAELVVMRLTEAEPVLSRFRFDMGGPILNANRDLAMAARGDTLLVAAQLGGADAATLTYLEIDASSLP